MGIGLPGTEASDSRSADRPAESVSILAVSVMNGRVIGSRAKVTPSGRPPCQNATAGRRAVTGPTSLGAVASGAPARPWPERAWLCCSGPGSALLSFPGLASATSLRFLGNGAGRDRPGQDPDRRPGQAGRRGLDGLHPRVVDAGATTGENDSEAVACDTNDGWITGNILFDRDVFGDGDHGDYGVSLTGGRIAFGVSAGSAGNTICGATVRGRRRVAPRRGDAAEVERSAAHLRRRRPRCRRGRATSARTRT